MHITLVLSFPYSMHRHDWPFVMAEMQQMTVERRVRRATVEFRDELYADDLLTSFMEHASRWRHVLAELQHCTFGYRCNDTQPESWDDECDTAAAFLDHRRIWVSVAAAASTTAPRSSFPRPSQELVGCNDGAAALPRHTVTHVSITASTSTHAGAAPTTLQLATKYDATSRSPKSVEGVQSCSMNLYTRTF